MIPDPLHPAIVHFPIVLAVLAPLLAAGAFWAIQSERLPRRSWLGIVILQVALIGTAWIATETGAIPPESALARTSTSGTMPSCSNANRLPVRPRPV